MDIDKIFKISINFADREQLETTLHVTPQEFSIAKKNKGFSGYSREVLDIILLELTVFTVSQRKSNVLSQKDFQINPSLEIIQCSEKAFFTFYNKESSSLKEDVLIWLFIFKINNSNKVKVIRATDADLLALKIIAEEANISNISKEQGYTKGKLYNLLVGAADKGYIVMPLSLIGRNKKSKDKNIVQTVKYFTLQWHITHKCELRCKHCYDRTNRKQVSKEQAQNILDQMEEFCIDNKVRGHICFSGGNPFLHEDFINIYKKAVEKGFNTSILANTVKEEELDNILKIKNPRFFQVSLEGFKEHNDYIRGKGYYDKVINFLELLKKKQISSAIMLTLTKDNMDQIIPLAEELKDKTDHFTYNRLSQTGEGAQLPLPTKEEYKDFIYEYTQIAKDSRVIGYKDNLINISLKEQKRNMFDGCTGFGCGAAFNFVALLPDGEVHACRKFPSLIGNVYDQSLKDIYNSEIAQKYRKGCSECEQCPISSECSGCMAVANGMGKDIFTQKDPFCFYQ